MTDTKEASAAIALPAPAPAPDEPTPAEKAARQNGGGRMFGAKIIKRFVREDDGVTAIEYGLIASLVAVAIIVSVRALGTQLAGTFGIVKNALQAA